MKHHYPRLIFVAMISLLLVSCACAAPTMDSVTTTNKEARFVGTCGTPPCWFSWGEGTNYYWTTPNQSAAGSFTDTQLGSPMLTGKTYHVRACDATGCSAASLDVVVPPATMMNITHFGDDVVTLWRSGFNITRMADVIIKPYAATMSSEATWRGDGAGIVWGLFFFFLFVGYWLRGKSILMPSILAVISGTFIIGQSVTSSMTGIVVAPVFLMMGVPLLIIGIAGVFFTWFTQ